MSKYQKLLIQVLKGTSDNNISFDDLCLLLERLGFRKRTKGDHQIYFKDNVPEIINLQPVKSKAKPYQVKQVRNLILKYNLGDGNV
jgi:predicted RNA binding protein YcfA (HicA-like mRNA interferase family)